MGGIQFVHADIRLVFKYRSRYCVYSHFFHIVVGYYKHNLGQWSIRFSSGNILTCCTASSSKL